MSAQRSIPGLVAIVEINWRLGIHFSSASPNLGCRSVGVISVRLTFAVFRTSGTFTSLHTHEQACDSTLCSSFTIFLDLAQTVSFARMPPSFDTDRRDIDKKALMEGNFREAMPDPDQNRYPISFSLLFLAFSLFLWPSVCRTLLRRFLFPPSFLLTFVLMFFSVGSGPNLIGFLLMHVQLAHDGANNRQCNFRPDAVFRCSRFT